MKKKSSLMCAISGAFLAAATIASPALALDTGCAPRDVIIKALDDEGQAQIISAKRHAIDFPKNIFTANASLSLGYNIEAGAGDEAGKLCVRAKYTNIHLNGDAKLARPSWANFGPNTDHDKWLASAETQANDKVLMGATALVKRPDGSEVPGRFIMVVRGNTAPGTTTFRNGGAATATSSRGSISTLMTMGDIDTNENFASLAKARVQTASVDTTTLQPH